MREAYIRHPKSLQIHFTLGDGPTASVMPLLIHACQERSENADLGIYSPPFIYVGGSSQRCDARYYLADDLIASRTERMSVSDTPHMSACFQEVY